MAPTLDPVVAHAVASALAAMFLLAGAGKLRDPAAFRITLEDYELLPAALTSTAAAAGGRRSRSVAACCCATSCSPQLRCSCCCR